jgi:hypothetical protein
MPVAAKARIHLGHSVEVTWRVRNQLRQLCDGPERRVFEVRGTLQARLNLRGRRARSTFMPGASGLK